MLAQHGRQKWILLLRVYKYAGIRNIQENSSAYGHFLWELSQESVKKFHETLV